MQPAKPSIAALKMAMKPVIAVLESLTLEIGKQFARLFQRLEQRKLQKFIYFAKANVPLMWEQLHRCFVSEKTLVQFL